MRLAPVKAPRLSLPGEASLASARPQALYRLGAPLLSAVAPAGLQALRPDVAIAQLKPGAYAEFVRNAGQDSIEFLFFANGKRVAHTAARAGHTGCSTPRKKATAASPI